MIQEIITDYKTLTIQEIATKYNKSVSFITKLLKDNNIPIDRNKKSRKINPTKEELEILYNTPLSLVEIAKSLGVSSVTIKKWFDKYNIPIRKHSESIKIAMDKLPIHPSTNKLSQEAQYVFSSKESFMTRFPDASYPRFNIAKDLGVSVSTIDHFLSNNGLSDTYKLKGFSGLEKELLNFILSMGVSIEHNVKGLLSNSQHEIDIWIPEKRIGIEFNGTYWHSTQHKDKNYHQKKTLDAIKNNIQLIHVFEHQWLNKEELVKNRLKSILQKPNHRIYARHCYLEKPMHDVHANIFFNKNHLQGAANATICLQLSSFSETMCAMSFGKSRFNKNETELIRFGCKSDTQVVGGASKLLKHYIKNYCKPGQVIVSYANLSHSTGNLYKALGFTFSHYTRPGYVWINLNTNQVLSRYQTMKKQLKKRFPNCDIIKTEKQILEENGYVCVYDCGHAAYKLVVQK